MPDVSVLNVALHGNKIGTLRLLQGDQIFAFIQEYIDEARRPTLTLSFKDDHGGLVTEQPATHIQVSPFFSNLLPEGPLRKYLADRAGVKEVREFFLLWVLGRDLPGAVTVTPTNGEAWPPADNAVGGGRQKDKALRFRSPACSSNSQPSETSARTAASSFGPRASAAPGLPNSRLSGLMASPRTNSR